MTTDSLQVQLRAVLPGAEGAKVFLGNDRKVFQITIDPNLGELLALAAANTKKDRPLTHDLMSNVWAGFGIRLQHIVITHQVGGTFYARMILKMQNELGVKIIEADCRPSDAMVLALQHHRPICVAQALWKSAPNDIKTLKELLRL